MSFTSHTFHLLDQYFLLEFTNTSIILTTACSLLLLFAITMELGLMKLRFHLGTTFYLITSVGLFTHVDVDTN